MTSPKANMSASCVGMEFSNPNFAGTKTSGAMNENVPPSATARADSGWSGSRTIIVDPKSARQARGGTSSFMRMFACYTSVQGIARNDK